MPGAPGASRKRYPAPPPAGKEIDVPLDYADYDFLEALLRLKAARAAS